MATVAFGADYRTEEYWDVTIDGVTVKITDRYMGEIVKRYLKKKGLSLQDGQLIDGLYTRM